MPNSPATEPRGSSYRDLLHWMERQFTTERAGVDARVARSPQAHDVTPVVQPASSPAHTAARTYLDGIALGEWTLAEPDNPPAHDVPPTPEPDNQPPVMDASSAHFITRNEYRVLTEAIPPPPHDVPGGTARRATVNAIAEAVNHYGERLTAANGIPEHYFINDPARGSTARWAHDVQTLTGTVNSGSVIVTRADSTSDTFDVNTIPISPHFIDSGWPRPAGLRWDVQQMQNRRESMRYASSSTPASVDERPAPDAPEWVGFAIRDE